MNKIYTLQQKEFSSAQITFTAPSREDMSTITASGIVSYDKQMLDDAYTEYQLKGGQLPFNRFVEKIVGTHVSSECSYHGVYGDIISKRENSDTPTQFVVEAKKPIKA